MEHKSNMKLEIDGELYEVEDLRQDGYLPSIIAVETDQNLVIGFYLAESSEKAGKAACRYWKDLKRSNPEEFRYLIGDERLIQWSCMESDNFGISNFQEFLDIVESVPEKEFGSYDGTELQVKDASEELVERLGFVPTVAYRYS